MIVTWIEWSDGSLSMHENIPGLSKETIRGWVKNHGDFNGEPQWIYCSADEKVKGTKRTRQEAIDALKLGLDAHEIDEHDHGRWKP